MAILKLKNILLKKAEVESEQAEQDEHERVQLATCIILL
jgi:hypothetical protein